MKKIFNIHYKILKNLDPELLSLRSLYNLVYSGQQQIYGTSINAQGYLKQLLDFVKKRSYEKANDALDNIFNILKPYIIFYIIKKDWVSH